MPFNQMVNTVGKDASGGDHKVLDVLSLRCLLDVQLNDSCQSGG